jgi:hypothetical protein
MPTIGPFNHPRPANPFAIDMPGYAEHHQTIRVELIHVSVIWYVVELSIPPKNP